ncbi:MULTISPECIES: valine--tRNA ligase [unclassified Ruegeria]|uniref:valine--tRNA ligase n=1 Tax=unclassified Ruegeria TaxID=2625375 RepID=UPI001487C9CB|nr:MULTISPECIES: valine--tRNA ligase [unclassified Ruegeria]NOD46891.1 valine--tRNA ligase [Ruegeria sp. HKCCD5849]NOD51214.1 valine--tRNA ligase [Ruegeria sp. HKCCD5851]NOD68033.1 valine--tRNA ligase [Ruegeria sp. HKCCD7303]
MAMEKTFNAAEAEARIYEAWEQAGAFKAGANKSRDESFTIMIPPPNVTGALHVGHAFNNTLQDILIRWHRMRGFDTLWQPGQDHAGIATQMQVEKMLANTQQPGRRELGREKFLEKVWEWKGEYGGTIIEQLKRLGSSCDWSRNAFTMAGAAGDPRTGHENSANFHDAVIKVFVDMYEKGLIYRGKRLVNWDPHFETAISDLEVENIEVAGHMWHFKYPLAGGETYEYLEKDEDGNVIFREERDYISIATTRPETMLGDGAVAVHPSDERYAPIIGKLCEIPVGPKEHRRQIPIITDDYPDPDFGSGAVKITGAHDFNDNMVAKRGGIPMYRLMDTKGAMRADGAPYAEEADKAQEYARGKAFTENEIDAINLIPDHLRGLDRFEARAKVVEEITADGLAVMTRADDPRLGTKLGEDDDPAALVPLVESKPIMQPFGDRSKVVIEPMFTDQWFVDAAKVVGPALDAVKDGTVKIIPESGEKTYYHWLENIEPWCISRQLWWGHQIPVWYGLDLSAENFEDDENDGDLDLVELGRLLNEGGMLHRGNVMECAASLEAVTEKFLDDNANIPSPLSHATVIEVADKQEAIHQFAESLAQYAVDQDPTKLVYPVWRDPDVLDTWFSSGLWPIGTLGWPEQTDELERYFPTDVLITGFDILFFWVARMMMMQLAVVDQIPFHTVYLHQLVRDEKGKKMSKTTGNVIDPLEIVDEFGADALRFTNASMAAIGGVLKLSRERITGYRNFGTKLWNAVRFAEMNEVFTDAVPQLDVADLKPKAAVNRWIIGETARVREEVDAALESYRFNDAANGLYAFVWGKVCDWYVELSKPLLQGDDAEAQAETRATMRWVLDQCMVLLHPIMPFITEELWGLTGARTKMVVHAEWPNYSTADLVDADADREMNWVISVIENTRSARAQMRVPAGLYVPMLVTEIDANGQAAWDRNEALIKRLARIDSLTKADELPKGTISIAAPGASFGLPLADIIDIGAEKERLEKAKTKLAKELGGLRGRLNNPKFVASAPEEVVEEAKANLAAREEEEAKLNEALARLAEIA